MNIEELKKAKENKTPVFIERSWLFSDEKTIITEVKENPALGGIVKVEGGNQYYEGYRVRIAEYPSTACR